MVRAVALVDTRGWRKKCSEAKRTSLNRDHGSQALRRAGLAYDVRRAARDQRGRAGGYLKLGKNIQ